MTTVCRLHFGDLRSAIGEGSVLAVGNFDGIHTGHLTILESVVSRARNENARPGVLSFYPHPAQVLFNDQVKPLTRLRQKVQILNSLGVEDLYLLHFTKSVSETSWEEFVERVLIGQLKVKHLIVGDDARIGNKGRGTPELLLPFLKARGVTLEVQSLKNFSDRKIGSAGIRNLIMEGEVSKAALCLGRPFALIGRIVKGDGRGIKIGFQTANLSYTPQVLPKNGVYVTELLSGSRTLPSVTNIGVRPTFGGSSPRVETHVLDGIKDELRGERVEIQFLERLRGEIKFPGIPELSEQIRQDIDNARVFFSSLKR